MPWIITKYLITAAAVVLITEIAKRSNRLGALVATLPLQWLPPTTNPTSMKKKITNEKISKCNRLYFGAFIWKKS